MTDVVNYREQNHIAAMKTLDDLTGEASGAGLYETSADDYADACVYRPVCVLLNAVWRNRIKTR